MFIIPYPKPSSSTAHSLFIYSSLYSLINFVKYDISGRKISIKKSPKGDLEWLTPLLFVITIFVVKICITIRTYQNWHAFGFMVLYCSIFIIQFLNNLLIHLHIFLELLLRIYILNNDSCTSCPVLFHLSGNKTLLLESFSFPSL